MRTRLAATIGAMLLLAGPLAAKPASIFSYVGQCVPFARMVSGIQIFGDAWTWWSAADGRYAKGQSPRIGAVLVFRQTARMRFGHVAVVSRIIDDRVVMVTHANWSRFEDGGRGRAEQDVTMTDVSPAGDWSAVKVWYRDSEGLGGGVYPTYGFIYGERAGGGRVQAHRELTSAAPDYVGSLIDAYR